MFPVRNPLLVCANALAQRPKHKRTRTIN
jgi:hypothetical protein